MQFCYSIFWKSPYHPSHTLPRSVASLPRKGHRYACPHPKMDRKINVSNNVGTFGVLDPLPY